MSYQDTFQRYEMKYLLTKQQKARLLWAMQPHMALDQYGRTTIQNIYYDTPDFALIRKSLEKPVYKEKLRLRSYGTAAKDSTVFLELKKKYKGIVYKRRTDAPCFRAEAYLKSGNPLAKQDQITAEIDYFRKFYKGLRPAMVISYEREAFYNKEGSDLRITLDENILWREEELTLRTGAYGNVLLEEGQTLMEIKVGGAMPLWLAEKLSELKIYQTSFSKYGNAYLRKMEQEQRIKDRKDEIYEQIV
ncbi:MAG: polyphosphate polymerase domain-containing protein [Lachnospiraceae bacterium]|nr:polyphosphate polymerase domain-containing protein [Lachnospiraceae bacterium]